MTEEHRRNRWAEKIDSGALMTSLAHMDNIQFWFRADSLDLSDNDPVSTWQDESGNERDAIQVTGVVQPTFKTGIVNGRPVCRFDGDWMAHLPTIYNLSTYFIVWNRVSAVANDIALQYDATNYVYLQYSNLWYVFTSASISVAMAASTFFLKSCVYDNVNYQRYTNGSAEASQVGTGDAKYRYIGGFGGQLHGDIAELAIFDINLSTQNRQYVEKYLNDKYALW